MPNDSLDTELCHTIRTCWGSTERLKSLKGLVLTQETLDFSAQFGQSEDDIVRGGWGCGDSASRICELLVGSELNNYSGAAAAPDAIDISSLSKLTKAIKDMKFTTGCILARINVLGGKSGSGHSYVFLGLNRESTTEPLDGHIYQTNIGCDQHFDLLSWINDAKFSAVVNLETHLQGLGAEMTKTPVQSYEQQYMLTNTSLTPKEVVQKASNPVEGVRFMWRKVDLNQARANLKGVRKPQIATASRWPTVAPTTGVRLTA
jgi:hypothetical protein